MKQTWNSFLQTVFQSIKMLSASAPAKRRRDTAVLTAGILLVTAITFAAGSFPETGNGAMVAFAETPGETGGQEEGTYDGNTDEEKRDPESIMARRPRTRKTEQRSEKRRQRTARRRLKAGKPEREKSRIRKRRLLRKALDPRKRQRPGRTPVRRKEKPRKERKLLNKQPSGRALAARKGQLPERALSLRKVQPPRRLPVRRSSCLHRKHRKRRHRSPCQTGITRRCLRSSRQRLETATGPEGSWWPM